MGITDNPLRDYKDQEKHHLLLQPTRYNLLRVFSRSTISSLQVRDLHPKFTWKPGLPCVFICLTQRETKQLYSCQQIVCILGQGVHQNQATLPSEIGALPALEEMGPRPLRKTCPGHKSGKSLIWFLIRLTYNSEGWRKNLPAKLNILREGRRVFLYFLHGK